MPCSDCGEEQVLVWSQVRWDKAQDGTHLPESARYQCVHCDARWSDEVRWSAVRRGRCVANESFAGAAGFRLNEIYSPWVRLEAMVKSFLSAGAGGEEAMKIFVSTSLGESWVETGEAPAWQRLQGLKEDWPTSTVPERGLMRRSAANAFDLFLDRPEILPLMPVSGELGWPALSVDLEVENRFPWPGGRYSWSTS